MLEPLPSRLRPALAACKSIPAVNRRPACTIGNATMEDGRVLPTVFIHLDSWRTWSGLVYDVPDGI